MSLTREVQTLIKLAAVPNLGPSGTRKLFARLEADETDLEYLLEFENDDLIALGLSDDQAKAFVTEDAVEISEQLVERGLRIITTMDTRVPSCMVHSRSTPWYFCFGQIDLLHSPSVGFSGSRDASPKAIAVTNDIAAKAAKQGWVVISGGARGIDVAAHNTALSEGGTTVVILAQGIATWRVPEELDMDRVLVLSEFSPLAEWGAYRAMQRNKSIVHLSDSLVIPQAGERGGTWNAGEYAVKQKQRVFVADMGEEFPGNQKLIRFGAAPLNWQGDLSVLNVAHAEDPAADSAQATLF